MVDLKDEKMADESVVWTAVLKVERMVWTVVES